MNTKQAFDKHYAKFQKNSIVKSILLGTTVGFAVAVILAAIFWFYGVKAYWITIPVAIAVTAGMTVLFNKTVFKPKAKEMAVKLDSLGLEERLITMTEYENDDSFIAKLQREDANKKSASVNSNLIKFAVSIPLCIGMAFALLLGSGMITVNALSSAGVIRSGKQIIEDINTVPDTYYNVYYVIEGSGTVFGEETQVLKAGESASAVMVVADYGYAFVKWSDGYTEPYRKDENVKGDMILTAIFEPDKNVVDSSEYRDGIGVPGDPEKFGEIGDNREWQDHWDLPPSDEDDNKNVPPGQDGDSVIDGETDYGGKLYSDAVSEAQTQLGNGSVYGDKASEIITDYLTGIKK